MMCGNFGRDEGDCERCGRTVASCTIKARIEQLEEAIRYALKINERSHGDDYPYDDCWKRMQQALENQNVQD